MFRTFAIFLGFVSLAWCENSLTRQERKEGFELLFDGKTLARWHSMKQLPDAGSWHVRKGVLTWGKGGSWLATDDTYYDFVLRLEYRTGPQSNSGIFLRSGPTGNPAFSGMELQILSDAGKPAGVHSTGSLYGAVAPAKSMAKPDGEWNQVEVTVIKRQVMAVWNGEKILDANLDEPKFHNAQEKPLAERLPFGHIGLQAYSTGAPVEFRNIRIKVLRIGPNFTQDK
jgi:Domain of Unknown Function (DUF1080)